MAECVAKLAYEDKSISALTGVLESGEVWTVRVSVRGSVLDSCDVVVNSLRESVAGHGMLAF